MKRLHVFSTWLIVLLILGCSKESSEQVAQPDKSENVIQEPTETEEVVEQEEITEEKILENVTRVRLLSSGGRWYARAEVGYARYYNFFPGGTCVAKRYGGSSSQICVGTWKIENNSEGKSILTVRVFHPVLSFTAIVEFDHEENMILLHGEDEQKIWFFAGGEELVWQGFVLGVAEHFKEKLKSACSREFTSEYYLDHSKEAILRTLRGVKEADFNEVKTEQGEYKFFGEMARWIPDDEIEHISESATKPTRDGVATLLRNILIRLYGRSFNLLEVNTRRIDNLIHELR